MTARLLAFDTATEAMAVALRCERGDFVTQEAGGALASQRLLPCIHGLLGQAGLGLSDLDAVAFGRGPGAFTGLRTSCAVAQGLGWGMGRPVLALDSLLVVAEDARSQVAAASDAFEVGVVMDARMGEAYAGRYHWADGRWSTLDAPALYSLPALCARWATPPPWLAGSAIAAFAARLGALASLPWVAEERQRGSALLRLAQAAFDSGLGVDAADALPLYLRDKVALTVHEREAAR